MIGNRARRGERRDRAAVSCRGLGGGGGVRAAVDPAACLRHGLPCRPIRSCRCKSRRRTCRQHTGESHACSVCRRVRRREEGNGAREGVARVGCVGSPSERCLVSYSFFLASQLAHLTHEAVRSLALPKVIAHTFSS